MQTSPTPTQLLPVPATTAKRSFSKTIWREGQTVGKIIQYLVLSFQAVLTIFPLIWVVSNSFRTTDQILTSIRIFPEALTFANYTKVLTATSIPRAFFNSVTITGATMLLLLAVVLPLAFALARFRFAAANQVYLFFSLAVLVPTVTVLPTMFRLYNELGLLGFKYAIAFVYVAQQLPISIFLMVMFMRSIPPELDEAAIIDGCGTWGIFRHIALPLSRNGIVTITILAFVAVWNDYINALVILTNQYDKTLSVVLAYARGEFSVDYGMMSAAIVIAVAPMIVVYLFIKERLIAGMAVGAVKG